MDDCTSIRLSSLLEVARVAGELDGARITVEHDAHDPEKLVEALSEWSDRLEAVVDEVTGKDGEAGGGRE